MASLRHTCATTMLSDRHLDVPNRGGGWIISAEETPTVDRLDASPIVIWKMEVLGLEPLVEGGHDGRGVVGVLQTQSVAQLVDGH